MIARTVKLQLGAFAVIGIAAMTYAGASVVLPTVVQPTFEVTAHFKDAGGTFSNGEVTYRGVNVGRIGKVRLEADGVAVTLKIEKRTAKIPAERLMAVVANKSAVGEQFIDLQPQSDAAPYLGQGGVIPQERTRIPVPVNTLAVDLDATARSVNLADLRTLVDELSKAAANTADPVEKLIANSDKLTFSLQDSLPATTSLINSSRINLQTARDTAGELRDFARGLSALSQQLVVSDPDLRKIVDNGIQAADQLDGFLTDVQPDLFPLLGNLVTASSIGAARVPGFKQTLMLLPQTTGRLHQAFHDSQLYTPLTLGEDFTPKCTYPAERRLPAQTAESAPQGGYYCPNDGGATAPRNSRYAPRPPGDNTAGPPSGSKDTGGPNRSKNGSLLTLAAYDPATGLASSAEGTYFEYKPDTGLSAELRKALGNRTWLALLMGLVGR